jgi:ligand-binding sensor domain-containing protein
LVFKVYYQKNELSTRGEKDMSNVKKSSVFKVTLATLLCATVIWGAQSNVKVGSAAVSTNKFSYSDVIQKFSNDGKQGQVKQYIKFLQDDTYKPSIANPTIYMPQFANANTFVNKDFTVKPSIFPSLREVKTSVLDASRTYLWIGTNEGVFRTDLETKKVVSYTAANGGLLDDNVLLLIDNGDDGVYAITSTGVTKLSAPVHPKKQDK